MLCIFTIYLLHFIYTIFIVEKFEDSVQSATNPVFSVMTSGFYKILRKAFPLFHEHSIVFPSYFSTGSADYGLWTKSSPVFIKSYWSTAIPIHLSTIHGCFHTVMAKLNNYKRPAQLKIFTYLVFYRKSQLALEHLCTYISLLKK